tara:strand:- start:816 stop:1274 length:459 start_codon:yes stop_codon:yes gene_type:complete
MTWTRTRTLALVLFASIALNLFFAGIMVGRFDRWHGGPKGPGHGPSMTRTIEKALGDSLTPELQERLKAHSATMRETRRSTRDKRDAIRDTLLQEPFDREAYLQALGSMNEVFDRMRAETHSFMIDIVEQMTPEQRRKLVKSLGRHRKDDDD